MPQVLLSEELRERFAEQQQTAQQVANKPAEETGGNVPPVETVADPVAVDWRFALQLTGLAGALVLPLLVLSYVVPPVGLLLSLWVLGTPIVLMGLYAARKPTTRITTGFGARLGLLSGLSIGLTLLLAMTANLFLGRFVAHEGKTFDQQIRQQMSEALKRSSLATGGDGSAADNAANKEAADDMAQLQRELEIPEFRAGFVLTGLLLAIVFYSVYSSATGAFSGYLRSRAARRQVS
jgi:uncharacterized membrane protein